MLAQYNLAKWDFLGTDLSKADLVGVKWPRVDGVIQLYDDGCEKDLRERRWDLMEKQLRDLKCNYESRRDYERAGEFHFTEMETRRRNPETSKGFTVLLWCYLRLSGYGERPFLALAWFLMVLLVGSYLSIPDRTLENVSTESMSSSIGITLVEKLRTMLLLRPLTQHNVGLFQGAVNTFLAISGPLLAGLFGMALRQRLRR